MSLATPEAMSKAMSKAMLSALLCSHKIQWVSYFIAHDFVFSPFPANFLKKGLAFFGKLW